jgi:hypothetical protein
MASKNYFDQLGEGFKRLGGTGSKGYWNQLFNMVKSPSWDNFSRGYGSLVKGIGSAPASMFGWLPDPDDKYDEGIGNKNRRQ